MLRQIVVMVFIVTLLSVVSARAQEADVVLSLTLNYDEGKLTLNKTSLIEGLAPDRLVQPESGYTAKIIAFNGETLYSFRFSIELAPLTALDPSWFDEKGNQIFFPNGTVPSLTRLTFVLNLPYFKNAKMIEIYNPSNKLALVVDVSDYSICNMNSVCDVKESYTLCPEDCQKEITKAKVTFWQRIWNFIKSIFT